MYEEFQTHMNVVHDLLQSYFTEWAFKHPTSKHYIGHLRKVIETVNTLRDKSMMTSRTYRVDFDSKESLETKHWSISATKFWVDEGLNVKTLNKCFKQPKATKLDPFPRQFDLKLDSLAATKAMNEALKIMQKEFIACTT